MNPAPFPRIGIGSYAYAWAVGVPGRLPARPMGAPEFLRRAVDHGVDLVQIDDNLPLHTLGPEALEGLRRQAAQSGISVEVGTRGSHPDHLLRYLDLAVFFSSPFLRVVVDLEEDRPSVAECARRFREVMPEFIRRGVVPAVENHDRFRIHDLLELLEAVGDGRLGVCLDTVNSFGCLENPDSVVDALAPFVVNLHAKDFVVRRASHGMGFVLEGTPAGEGMLRIDTAISRIREAGRPFTATLELWPPPEESVEATVAKEEMWVARSLAHLRRLAERRE